MRPILHIDDYQIHLPPLGEGSFGTVYRATYRGISERALKIFKPDVVDLPAMARELEKLSSVAEHPGIVTLHDFDLVTNAPYYAMSLHAQHAKDGSWRARSLADLCGKVDAREAARLIDQIANALAYLHRHQVLHCDIKPSNVMLTDEAPPRIKICDFGQSRGSNVRSADAAGTPLYSSPEQLLHPGDSSDGKGFRWDVYSFGVLAYKLITGKLPRLQHLANGGTDEDFDASIQEHSDLEASVADASGGSNAARLAKMLNEEEEILWPPDAKIDSRRKAIITKCLSLDVNERPSDMREVRNDILRSQHERDAVRSRNIVLSLSLLAVAAVLATSWAFFEAHQARQARLAEEKARKGAEELVNFILFDLREKLRPIGKVELLEHIADNADTYFSSLSKDMQTVHSLRTLASVLQGRGDAEVAGKHYQEGIESFQKAFNIYDQLQAIGKGDDRVDYLAAQVLVSLGDAYARTGETSKALELFENALQRRNIDIYRQRISQLPPPLSKDEDELPAPTLETYMRSTADIYNRAAVILSAEGRTARAIDSYEKALAINKDVLNLKNQLIPAVNVVARLRMLSDLGDIYRRQGRPKDAAEKYQEAIRDGKETYDVFTDHTGIQDGVARASHALGGLSLDARDFTQALEFYREEVRLREAIRRREPGEPEWILRLAESHAGVAECYRTETASDRALALTNYRRAVQLLEGMPDENKLEDEVESLIATYRERISELLEMDE